MEFEIREIENLSGEQAHVYSVVLEGESNSLLEQFFIENAKYKKEIKTILHKIYSMTHYDGCKRQFFKEGEGKWGDGVVALNHTGTLRLYGIYFNRSVIIFGSGGHKPPSARTYQDHPPLNKKAKLMIAIAKEINKSIHNRELIINNDGTLSTE